MFILAEMICTGLQKSPSFYLPIRGENLGSLSNQCAYYNHVSTALDIEITDIEITQ
jgi:hypothetical protein